MSAMLPPLRGDVAIVVRPDGLAFLEDTVLGRRIKLDARARAICEALGPDGAALDDVAGAAGTTPEVVATFVGRLAQLDLVASARAAARVAERQALFAVRARPSEHLRPLPNARFACTMCGSCCGGHNVGPVAEAVLDGLDEALVELEPIVRAARRLAPDKDLFVTLPGAVAAADRATPHVDVMCHASHGSCVFLDDAGLCRIHAKLGGDKKPLPCRIFPWELVATPTGVRASVQRECRDFLAATSADKPSLDEAHAELAALVRAIPELPTARPLPTLRGRELDTWADYEALEAALLREADAHDGADARALFAGLARHVAPTGAANGAGTTATFASWRDTLASRLSQILRAAPAPDARSVFRVDAARVLVLALEAARGWVLARALAPMPIGIISPAAAGGGSDVARLATSREADPARLLREHVRHALWATAPTRATCIEAGLARLHAEWLCARLIALARAREVKRFHLTTQDVQDGLVVASFLFRHDDLQPILAELDPLTTAVFLDGVGDLATRAPDDDGPDARLELVKF